MTITNLTCADSIDWYAVSKAGFPMENGEYFVLRINPYEGCNHAHLYIETWYNDRKAFNAGYATTKKAVEARREEDENEVVAWAQVSIPQCIIGEVAEAWQRRDERYASERAEN